MGGLSKKAYQLKELRRETKLPDLTVDGGALLFGEKHLPPALEAQARITARGIVKAYNLMGYDAVGVSRYDLADGLSFLRRMAAESKFCWLSANLVGRADRQPLFTPSLIKKVGGLTIGLIGLTGSGGPVPDEALILPWQEALPRVVAKLRAKANLIILLDDSGPQQLAKITAAFPAITLAIEAGGKGVNQAPQLSHQTLLCRTAEKGKYLGMLTIDWQGRPNWGRSTAELLLERKRALDRLDWQLRHLPPSAALRKEKGRLTEEITAMAANKEKISSYKNHFLPMDSSVPDEETVEIVVDKIHQEISRLGRRLARREEARKKGHPSYAGWQACARCHPVETRNWQRTRHAVAYRTLAAKQQQFNLNCLPCHVTGIKKRTTAALVLPEGLRAVGCEVCHGPGEEHVRAPRRNPLRRLPAAKVCLRCHTPEHDDHFIFWKDLKLAAHPVMVGRQ